MKQFLTIILLFGSFGLLAQTDESYMHEYKKGPCTLFYSYIQRNDSTFMYGYLKAKKTNAPVLNVNINVKDFSVGTVPRLDGNFLLFLPRQEGTIIFDKTGNIYFEFPYEYRKEKLKRPSAHH